MKRFFILFFATGGFLGHIPLIPGTMGTLWGVGIYLVISLLNPLEWALSVAFIAVFAVIFSSLARKILGADDPQKIVCDEASGFCAASFLVPFSATNIMVVFIIFRIFDILKPPPIKAVEKRLKGGLSIVLDDILAGVYANLVSQVIIRHIL